MRAGAAAARRRDSPPQPLCRRRHAGRQRAQHRLPPLRCGQWRWAGGPSVELSRLHDVVHVRVEGVQEVSQVGIGDVLGHAGTQLVVCTLLGAQGRHGKDQAAAGSHRATQQQQGEKASGVQEHFCGVEGGARAKAGGSPGSGGVGGGGGGGVPPPQLPPPAAAANPTPAPLPQIPAPPPFLKSQPRTRFHVARYCHPHLKARPMVSVGALGCHWGPKAPLMLVLRSLLRCRL